MTPRGRLDRDERRTLTKGRAQLQALHDAIVPCIAVLVDIRDVMRNVDTESGNYANDRSDAWHESDAGSCYLAWSEAIGEATGDLAEYARLADDLAETIRTIDRILEGP